MSIDIRRGIRLSLALAWLLFSGLAQAITHVETAQLLNHRHQDAGAACLDNSPRELGCASPDNRGLSRDLSTSRPRLLQVASNGTGAMLVPVQSDTVKQKDFVHPGILVTVAQIEYVRNHLELAPWKEAFYDAVVSQYADLSYQPHPWEEVECGSYSNPDKGCSDEVGDAQAAYTQALLWLYTKDKRYAANTVAIINAWATTLKRGHVNSNAALQASWAAELFTRAAELVKYTYSEWPQPEKDKVTRMFREQYQPDIERVFTQSGYNCYTQNWQASATEALLNISVFNKDTLLFDEAVSRWRGLIPAYIYIASDGPLPKRAPWCSVSDQQIVDHWNHPKAFVEGLTRETCRDLEHTAYGLAALINAAETARVQGVDLYDDPASKSKERLTKAMELHSLYQNGGSDLASLCEQPLTLSTSGTFEIGYNHYAIRLAAVLPHTEVFLNKTRPTRVRFHYMWETLTHGLIGDPH
ncbi:MULTISPECIES: alginate lyase family protein [unclassified Pseudomonas]|uniref:alginate lyase family protein n=1 Tax=unclassified Pseudomonas TaxID=196821 RepID=UPI000C2FBED0|nr:MULTISPECIES: alginate lyase family protein [unclassified Pseudomonas]MCU1737174.1 alginate lyase family protein [Pseudomonas sp. 20S_6.2_Bac1]